MKNKLHQISEDIFFEYSLTIDRLITSNNI